MPSFPRSAQAARLVSLSLLTLALGEPCLRGSAHAQTAPNRVAILVDSSASMLTTPEQVTFPETCLALGWNGCTSAGNPSAAQESCNACMAYTLRQTASCASNFTAACRSTYSACARSVTGGSACVQTLGVQGGVSTRGDGSALTPGCDVDGDGLANDSALYQAKEALRSVAQATPGVELALWRFAQLEGGGTCSVDTDCPSPPAGPRRFTCRSVAGVNRCMLDAATLGPASGQCAPFTWNGADASFTCASCGAGLERVVCDAHRLEAIRSGGTSPLAGTVQCALPATSHPYLASHGALITNGSCDLNGGELLVDFPASAGGDNRAALTAWLDHTQPNLSSDVELTANGASSLAASLRDLRAWLLATARADSQTPCRSYRVVLVVGGEDTCEGASGAAAAAATFQGMSFTSAAGVPVLDYDVPVYVLAFGVCPPGQPGCAALAGYDAIAAAGGTGTAIQVDDAAALADQLSALSNLPPTCGCVDGVPGSGEPCDGGAAVPGDAGAPEDAGMAEPPAPDAALSPDGSTDPQDASSPAGEDPGPDPALDAGDESDESVDASAGRKGGGGGCSAAGTRGHELPVDVAWLGLLGLGWTRRRRAVSGRVRR
jgi:hypothetical protein